MLGTEAAAKQAAGSGGGSDGNAQRSTCGIFESRCLTFLRGPVSPDRGTRGNSSQPRVHTDKIGPPARAAEPFANLLPVVRQMKERGVRTRGVNHEN